jgi:CheY-like chemotaxis protein
MMILNVLSPTLYPTQQALPILIVEDSVQWQAAFKTLLSLHPEKFNLLGIVTTKAETINVLKTAPYHPHDITVILDWELPEGETGLMVFETLVTTVGIQAPQILLVSGTPAHQLPILPFQQIPKTQAGTSLIPALLARWEAFQQNDIGQRATA